MVRLNLLYQGKQQLAQSLAYSGIEVEAPCLVRIYTASLSPEQAVYLAREVKELLPAAAIMGSSGSGIIYEGNQYENDTLLVIEQLESGRYFARSFSYFGKSVCEAVADAASFIKDITADGMAPSLVHTVFGGRYRQAHGFVDLFNRACPGVKLTGGIAGDVLFASESSYIFSEEGAVVQGFVMAAVWGEAFHAHTWVNTALEAISPVYTIDECRDTQLFTIEGQPALGWCREQLGLQQFREYKDWQEIADEDDLIRFPIMLEDHKGTGRFLKYVEAIDGISLHESCLEDGTSFRIGYSSPTKCAKECYDICRSIAETPAEGLFCYSCLFRKLYLSNCAQWELGPFVGTGICGVFMLGEISWMDGSNEFLNGSCCIVGTGETDSCLSPDFSVFEDMYKIEDDNDRLLKIVLKKQNEAVTRENQKLMERLLRQQEEAKRQLYVDAGTGMFNTIKYSEDNKVFHYNKLCMIQVDNGELLMAHLGKERYFRLFRDVDQRVRSYIGELNVPGTVNFYILSNSVAFMVADRGLSEDEFMMAVVDLYENFRIIQSHSADEYMINRFAVVLNQDDLVEKAVDTLQASRNSQSQFFLYNETETDDKVLRDELNMVRIVSQAIERKKVFPYFQGIYDNEEKRIRKYEALMRIEDEEGNVYAPGRFLKIARKYHLYSRLSMMMMGQVFDLFSGREEEVSINLSAYDIYYPEMQAFILERIKRAGDAGNFIFEILEDEELRNMEELKRFINQCRSYHVRVAIDDFGIGYSNFMEIARIEPNFIKIDGSIVKNEDGDKLNQKVLENIVFLARQLDTQLVAEYVETKQIQERIWGLGIRYSQGFYFAKPVPFEELHLDEGEEIRV